MVAVDIEPGKHMAFLVNLTQNRTLGFMKKQPVKI